MYREVTMIELREALRLWQEHLPKKQIAARLGLDPKTVRRYVRAAEAVGLEAAHRVAHARAFELEHPHRLGAAQQLVGRGVLERQGREIDGDAAALEQLDRELNAQGVHMAFAEMRQRLQELVYRYGLFETLDRDRFYPTLETGLRALTSETGRRPKDAAGEPGA